MKFFIFGNRKNWPYHQREINEIFFDIFRLYYQEKIEMKNFKKHF
jgi:hypothetical protein